MSKAKNKSAPIGYELINPKTNRGIGVAVIQGEACVLADKTGISKTVMLLSQLRFVSCEGKLYVPYDEVIAWFYNEIDDEEKDPGPDPTYIDRLRQKLGVHFKDRSFVERYRERRSDLESMVEIHEAPSLPEDKKPIFYVMEGFEDE
jgi:hypothetical protein